MKTLVIIDVEYSDSKQDPEALFFTVVSAEELSRTLLMSSLQKVNPIHNLS